MSEPGRSRDLRFGPWVVKSSPKIWNKIPVNINDMYVQPIKDIHDIKETYTSDMALETRQFQYFPTSEPEGCLVFWS